METRKYAPPPLRAVGTREYAPPPPPAVETRGYAPPPPPVVETRGYAPPPPREAASRPSKWDEWEPQLRSLAQTRLAQTRLAQSPVAFAPQFAGAPPAAPSAACVAVGEPAAACVAGKPAGLTELVAGLAAAALALLFLRVVCPPFVASPPSTRYESWSVSWPRLLGWSIAVGVIAYAACLVSAGRS